MLTFRYTILYVQDVSESLKFYTSAFGFEQLSLHESGDYGELKTGDAKLAFGSLKLMNELGKSPSAADADSPCFEIAFETTEVASSLQKAVEAGAMLVQDVTEMPWGQQVSYVRDINGFLIEICSPIQTQS